MRGRVDAQSEIFHTFNLHELIPAGHPLRQIKKRADAVLAGMSREFNAAYGKTGRPSIPPERLIKAMLLMALYSIRSERQLCYRSDPAHGSGCLRRVRGCSSLGCGPRHRSLARGASLSLNALLL